MKEEWRNPKLAGCTPKSVEEMEEEKLGVAGPKEGEKCREREKNASLYFCYFPIFPN